MLSLHMPTKFTPEQRSKQKAAYLRSYRRKKQANAPYVQYPLMYPGLTYEVKCLLDEERIIGREPEQSVWVD